VTRLIAIDADVVGRRRGGEETAIRGWLAGLDAIDPPATTLRFVAYLRDPRTLDTRGVVATRTVAARSNYLRVVFAVPRQVRADQPTLFHANYVLPPGLACRTVLTVHDCSWQRLGESMPIADRVAFRRFVPWSARRADRIITPSHHARSDLLTLLPFLDPDRVSVVGLGVDASLRPDPDAARRAAIHLGFDEPYVACLGAVQPRKNIARLLEAWATLVARGARRERLVIAGRPKQHQPAYEALADQLGIRDRVVFCGYVADPAMILAGARLVVVPSLYEGFGLPALEAMACATPVVASDTTALAEVCGDAAVLVDALSASAIATALSRVLDNPAEQARLAAAGPVRARSYSWAAAARQLVACYEQTISEAPATR
jgi:glycosyltransferase involved in cell wall biosynthesis